MPMWTSRARIATTANATAFARTAAQRAHDAVERRSDEQLNRQKLGPLCLNDGYSSPQEN